MKSLVLLVVMACAVSADLDLSSTQNTNKIPSPSKATNTFPTAQKPEPFYHVQFQQQQQAQQQPQPQPQYIPVQFVQSPLFQHQQPQAAMIIIAQPAAVPHQMLYSTAAQQLLNYFNSNPQAKYQLLNGFQGQQQQQPVQYVQPSYTPAPSYTYQVMAAQPQYQFPQQTTQLHSQPQLVQQAQSVPAQQQQYQQFALPAPAHQTFGQTSQYQLPNFGGFGPIGSTQLSHISTLAQLTAQKYLPPLRSASPIITGLENFTPEQQAQIKAQLNSGGPITPIQSNLVLPNSVQQSAGGQKTTGQTGPSSTAQDFTASPEDKTPVQTQTSNSNYNSAGGYRNQYTKG